jgi:hypothetical protein
VKWELKSSSESQEEGEKSVCIRAYVPSLAPEAFNNLGEDTEGNRWVDPRSVFQHRFNTGIRGPCSLSKKCSICLIIHSWYGSLAGLYFVPITKLYVPIGQKPCMV